jgi:hypothetical protein
MKDKYDHATAGDPLLNLLADIRAAAGDPEGKLMQDELVEHIAQLYRNSEHDLPEAVAEIARLKREHRAMSKGAEINARVAQSQAKQIAELREATRNVLHVDGE